MWWLFTLFLLLFWLAVLLYLLGSPIGFSFNFQILCPTGKMHHVIAIWSVWYLSDHWFCLFSSAFSIFDRHLLSRLFFFHISSRLPVRSLHSSHARSCPKLSHPSYSLNVSHTSFLLPPSFFLPPLHFHLPKTRHAMKKSKKKHRCNICVRASKYINCTFVKTGLTSMKIDNKKQNWHEWRKCQVTEVANKKKKN